MLNGKNIVLGVTGGIAAYKMATLASMLVKLGATVRVILTENGSKFITPHTFEALTHNRCMMDTFDRGHNYNVEHVSIAQGADLIMVAPATANTIGKMAGGIADNLLLTTVLAAKCKIAVAPAMNTGMYENPLVQENIEKISRLGMDILEPSEGYLACGDTGKGKMQEPEELCEYICNELAFSKDLVGKKVLVTAGATREAIDPVRYISNGSTGKMGYALARVAVARGADVTLISGKTELCPPSGVTYFEVTSAQEMYEQVMFCSESMDIIIKAAAVSDFKPRQVYNHKVKKLESAMEIEFEHTQDILLELGNRKTTENNNGQYQKQILCGFAMETENLLAYAQDKLIRKNLDIIVANSLKEEGSGFAGDTNVVTIITQNEWLQYPLMSKESVAGVILDSICKLQK